MSRGVRANGVLLGLALGDALGAAFANAYSDEPWRGYGAGPPRVFAMVSRGAMAGAAWGLAGVPGALLERLEARDELERLAVALVAV